MDKKVLLLGEPMILFIAEEIGKLESVKNFSTSVCGAELNVSIGLSRLGFGVEYVTKLGNDSYGKIIYDFLKNNHIGTSFVSFSEKYPTGYMKKSKVTSGDPEIEYHRKGSASSNLSVSDVKDINLKDFSLLHFTGISVAISKSCKEAVLHLARQAKKEKIMFSFDPNIRRQLWENETEMKNTLNEIAFQSDVFLPGIKEAEILCGLKDYDEIADFYLNNGCKTIVIKLGAEGAYFADFSGKRGLVKGIKVDKIVDTVGAGDAFASGVLTGLLEGLSTEDATMRGNELGALQIQVKGDNEGLPTREELNKFENKLKNI